MAGDVTVKVMRLALPQSEIYCTHDLVHTALQKSVATSHLMRKQFPTKVELQRICKEFRLGTFVSTPKDFGGMFNLNWRIHTSTGDYAVRVMSGYVTPSHLQYTHKVIFTLHKAKIPVSIPLINKQGKRYLRLRARQVQVTPFVNGQVYAGTARHIYSSGRMLRRFHHALKYTSPGPKPRWSNYPARRVMTRGLERIKVLGTSSQYATVRRLYHQVINEWTNVNRNLPTTVIHNDWHMWNQLYKPSGDVCSVLDFDFVQRGERLLDVGYALWMICTFKPTRKLARHFLRGYGKLRPQEYRALPTAIALASLYNLCSSALMTLSRRRFHNAFKCQVPFLNRTLSPVGKQAIYTLYK